MDGIQLCFLPNIVKVCELPGYEDISSMYYIDMHKGILHGRSGPLKPFWSRSPKYPYNCVDLSLKEGGHVHKRLDRIIGIALVPGRSEERNEIDHLNGIHNDDRPENLEWVSRKENMRRMGERRKNGRG